MRKIKALLLLSTMLSSGFSFAKDCYYLPDSAGGSGGWNDSTRWEGGNLPDAGDNVILNANHFTPVAPMSATITSADWEFLKKVARLQVADAKSFLTFDLGAQDVEWGGQIFGGGNVIKNGSGRFVITGNPGTGKTSVARKLGEVFKAVGLLPTSKVIEVDRGQMIGQYLGETPKIVNEQCDRGILFIDEAYTLMSGGSDDRYGKEAVETLMKRMEDDRGKFVVIAAGYQAEMTSFLQTNPGLEGRFTHRLHIDDYNEMELMEIFKKLLKKKKYELAPTAEGVLMEKIIKLCISKTASFANAREVIRLFDHTIQHLSLRVSMMPAETRTETDYVMIQPEDFEE